MASTPHIWRFFRSGGFDQARIESAEDLLALEALDQKLWVSLSCPVRGIEMDTRTLQLMDFDGDGTIRAPELISSIKWVAARLSDPSVLVQELPGIPIKAINATEEPGKHLAEMAHTLAHNLGKGADAVLTGAEIAAAQGALIEKEQAQWLSTGEEVRFIGEQTEAAHKALNAVAAKIDDYFARCQLARFDERATLLLDAAPETFAALSKALLTNTAASIAEMPLARVHIAQINKDDVLSLEDGINPAWQAAMKSFVQNTVQPLLGEKTQLTLSEWRSIKQQLAPYGAWLAAKPVLSKEAGVLADLEKLALLTRDLLCFANNYVSFKNFYTRNGKAAFQAGTLYLDGRSADLCIKIEDVAKHSALAIHSHIFLVYCECVRPGAKMTIAAAFTNGDSDQLTVGRNGLFYDRQGLDWNATIVKVIDHPISLRQAFWSPYKKFSRMVSEQLQKFAASKESSMDAQLEQGASQAVAGVTTPEAKSVGQQAFDVGKFAGIFAAIGLAVGALGTALAAILTGLLGLVWWKIVLVILAIILIISGPSVVLAWFRLRVRRLGPLLDANGWAINARATINIPFGASLTQLARLPDNAERSLIDPYAEPKTSRNVAVLVGLCLILAGLVWWNFF